MSSRYTDISPWLRRVVAGAGSLRYAAIWSMFGAPDSGWISFDENSVLWTDARVVFCVLRPAWAVSEHVPPSWPRHRTVEQLRAGLEKYWPPKPRGKALYMEGRYSPEDRADEYALLSGGPWPIAIQRAYYELADALDSHGAQFYAGETTESPISVFGSNGQNRPLGIIMPIANPEEAMALIPECLGNKSNE